jgi:hypothetical protein
MTIPDHIMARAAALLREYYIADTTTNVEPAARAILTAVQEERLVTNDKIMAVVERASDFDIALEDWQANALLLAAIRNRSVTEGE